jgi:regulator of protease activity HflC (stomatin/prohibitin superfamily)
METSQIIKLSAFGIAAVAALSVVSGCFFNVDQNERAVVSRNGAFAYVAEPGLHFKIPFIDHTTQFPTDLLSFTTGKLNTYTIDNQEVDAVLRVQYRLPESAIEYTFANNRNYSSMLEGMVISRWKTAAGRVNVTDIANNRGKLVSDVGLIVKDEAKRLYQIDVIDVQLPDLDYQASFRDAQAKAAVVKTEIESAEGNKRKASVNAETAKIVAEGEANRAIEAARGLAESTRLQAQAEAGAIQIKGEAQAKSQELLAKALSANSNLVSLTYAQRWDGKLPVNMLGSAPLPLIDTGKVMDLMPAK